MSKNAGFTLPAAVRVKAASHFARAYRGQRRRDAGCLVIYGAPNGLAHARLGISASRKVGNAVARNAVKRLLREAFRLEQHALPPGLDLVVVVRPHALRLLASYRSLLVNAARALDRGGTGS